MSRLFGSVVRQRPKKKNSRESLLEHDKALSATHVLPMFLPTIPHISTAHLTPTYPTITDLIPPNHIRAYHTLNNSKTPKLWPAIHKANNIPSNGDDFINVARIQQLIIKCHGNLCVPLAKDRAHTHNATFVYNHSSHILKCFALPKLVNRLRSIINQWCIYHTHQTSFSLDSLLFLFCRIDQRCFKYFTRDTGSPFFKIQAPMPFQACQFFKVSLSLVSFRADFLHCFGIGIQRIGE